MKKLLLLIWGCLTLLPGYSQIFDYNGISYNITSKSDKTCEVTENHGISGDIIIPETVMYEGTWYSVTVIGYKAFYGCSGLTSVEIPNSVTKIGGSAFSFCSGLTSVTLPGGITSLPSWCFDVCENLKTLIIPQESNITSIDSSTFLACNITEFIILISDINQYVLKGCPTPINLANLVPNNVRLDKMQYLYNGASIKNLVISMGVEKIADYAFYKNKDIVSISFPDGFKKIGAHSFEGTEISSLKLPESLESVGEGAFKDCRSLYSVSFPTNISEIQSSAFAGCTALYEVKIPESISVISDNLFNGCSDLEIVSIPSELTEIGNGAFSGCRLASISLPQSIEKIGNEAFAYNPFTEFNFPGNLKTIGDKALYDCGLVFNKLSFHEGLVSIGCEAFSGDYKWYYDTDKRCNIKSISLPSSLEFIGADAFNGSTFTEVTIPIAMTEVSDGAFSGCEKLQKVFLHENVDAIGASAFANTGIINITLPEKLTAIGANAFKESNILSFSVPNSVTGIGENAFPALHYLKLGTGFNDFSVKFCDSTDVLELMEATPPALTADRLWFDPQMVLVPEGAGNAYKANTRWKDYNIVAKNSGRAVIYLSSAGTLASEIRLQSGLMPGAVTNLSVEGPLNNDDFAIMRSNMDACYDIDLSRTNVTDIPDGAFKGKTGLLDLVLPNSVVTIGESAFQNCYLMRTNIPASIRSIGNNAFENCESMDNEILFSESISKLGSYAFRNCRNIKGVDMSSAKNVSLGHSVFSDCYGLTSVSLPTDLSAIPENGFENSGVIFIEVPSTASIGGRAFSNCFNLKEVVINKGVSTIGDYAFSGSGLTYVSIPSTVKSIPSGCFQGSGLVYADMEGTTRIAGEAFAGCSSLIVVNLPSALESMGEGSLNSASLTAINSPSATPAATNGNPFADVSRTACALSIPKPSFSSYLGAEYWGGFVSIRNSIDVSQVNYDEEGEEISDEANAEDPASELTYMDEEDYQEMLEDMEEENGDEPQQVRRKALRIMRANSIVDINRGYGKLFNNASLFLDENAVTRFFITLADDVSSFTVTYNGKDITNEVDLNTMSFVIDGLKRDASLVVTTNGHTVESGVDIITGDELFEDENAPYYNLNGQIVKSPTPGIYIHNGKKVVMK